VYFPKGDAWIDWWDATRHEGGTRLQIDAPLGRLPLFVRAGASIPTQPVVQHTGEMNGAPLTIAVAAGADGSSRFFQDAGDGYGYRKGQSRTIVVTQDKTGVRLDIPRNRGWQRIEAVEFVGIDAAPALVRIDGKPARDVRFDAQTRRLRVALPNEGVKRIELLR
jgi:alpha-glucosidase